MGTPVEARRGVVLRDKEQAGGHARLFCCVFGVNYGASI